MCELVAGDHRSPLASGDSRRVAFLETLQKFRTERGKAQFRPPVVHKIELDLYELFRRVCSFGGYASVVKKIGTWSTIWKLLPNYDPCVTDASNRLKKNYEKYLLDFERYCHPEFHQQPQQPQVPLQMRRLSTDGTSLAGSNSSGNSDESVAVNHNDNDGNGSSSSSGGGNGAAPPGSPTAPSSAELQQQQPPGTAPGDNRRAPGGATASAAAAAAARVVTGGVKRGRSATADDGGTAAADGGGGEQRLVLLCHAIAVQQQDGTQPHTASSSRHQRPLLDVRRPLSAASAKRAKVSAVGRQQQRYGEAAAAVVVPRHLHRQPQPQQPQAAACFLSLLHSSEDTAVHALLVMSAGGYR